jgi:PadR family transcriptional regulator PadR
MRRKAGTLVPLEVAILEASVTLRARGLGEAHGFLLARTVGDLQDAKRLTSYGTLYKALDRLERAGCLESRWEDPDYAAEASRPRRRFYRITAVGESALAGARAAASPRGVRRTAPTGEPVR